MSRTNLSAVVSRQLPEHIREDYPTFVAFVEAYYEYLQAQGVDFSTIRDIDRTLESFIGQFKKELAHNLPNIVEDERFLLQNVKDQYLAKGSEGSYKLLFRLLFGKEVELVYPGRSMLRASDGRWNQEISLFAKVDYGNAESVVGKLVDIQTPTRILRVLIDRRQDIVGEVDRIVLIDPTRQVYEFFLDKRFFGNVNAGDRIRFRDEFQATILPATQRLSITQRGKNFRVGQVFELRSGTGTGALMKVTAVTDQGGIKYAEIIKFGIGYTADFAVSLLATNSVTSIGANTVTSSSTLVQESTYSSAGAGTITASSSSTTVTGSGTNFGQAGGPAIGDELWSTDSTPKTIGVIKSIASTTSLTLVGVPSQYENPISGTYTGSFTFRNTRSVGSLYAPGGTQAFTFESNLTDRTLGFDEQGYVNLGDYITHEYVDGTYAGSLIREFSLNFRNAQSNAADPAIVEIDLGALARYPGYFETNNGFLDDSIYIQDSKYYQAFSYVLKLDERLASYSSAVKTMLHPAGMALFGEFNITNNYDLSVALESLVKSLGIGLEDTQAAVDSRVTIETTKVLSSAIDTPVDGTTLKTFGKELSSSIDTPTDDNVIRNTGKLLTTSQEVADSAPTEVFGKALSTSYPGMLDVATLNTGKALATSQTIADITTIDLSKPLSTDYSGIQDSNALLTTKSLASTQEVADSPITEVFGKALSTSYSGMLDVISSRDFTKSLATSQSLADSTVLATDKYVSPDTLDPQTEEGYIGLNPYAGEDFFAAEYSVGSRASTFTTP
jgi:hypothetical protein